MVFPHFFPFNQASDIMKSPSFFDQDIIQFLYGEDGMDGLWIEASWDSGTTDGYFAILSCIWL